MATSWTGRSGRRYTRDQTEEPRAGGMASIVPVLAEGPAPAGVDLPAGSLCALKTAARDPLARETMTREVETFALLNAESPAPPCPRMFDVIEEDGTPVGLVMEWCPTDMERWWDRMLVLPDAMEPLCGALADVCRRIGEYHAIMAARGVSAVHADIKPRNAVLARDGRWLLTDFGAAKSRPIEQETWEATRLILGTENFIAPEMIFNARKRHPQAMDTWSVGATLFALLKMRRHRLFGQELPIDGTHNVLFRCQRMSTVTDLRERKPALFVGQDLDPAAFFSPERLPDEDRQTIAQALLGVFGVPDERRELILEHEILALLDKALAIDPARRFTRAEDMSRAFDRIVQRYWELEGSLRETPADLSVTYELTETETMRSENEFDEGRPTVVASDPAGQAALAEPPPVAPEPEGPSDPPGFEPASNVEDRTVLAADLPGVRSPPPPAAEAAPPPWAGATPAPPDAVFDAPDTVVSPAPPSFGTPEESAPAPLPVPAAPEAVAESGFAPQTIIPPFEAEAPAPAPAATWAGEPPPPAPAVSDEQVLRLLEGIQAQLGKRPTARPAPPARTPTWAILAIGLLLFCQAIQFGLLLYMSFGGSSTFPGFGAPTVSSAPAPVDITPAAVAPEPVPEVVEPEPEVLEPEVIEPLPAALDQGGGEPEVTEPDVAEPEVTEPEVIEPEPAPAKVEPAKPAPRVVAAAPRPAPAPAAAPPAPAAHTTHKSSGATPASATGDASEPAPKPTSHTSSAPPPAPKAAPAATTPAAAGDGTIEVLGAQAYVVGAGGRKPCGGLPAGTYEVFAQPSDGSEYLSLGVHTLAAGEHMTFRCGFGSCKRLQ
ncbi:MAG: hypothetical protein ABIO70_14280 [Pseudomonadota bacterium]